MKQIQHSASNLCRMHYHWKGFVWMDINYISVILGKTLRTPRIVDFIYLLTRTLVHAVCCCLFSFTLAKAEVNWKHVCGCSIFVNDFQFGRATYYFKVKESKSIAPVIRFLKVKKHSHKYYKMAENLQQFIDHIPSMFLFWKAYCARLMPSIRLVSAFN